VEDGAEIQNKDIGNIFNEIIAENFPNLCNNTDTHIQKEFWTLNRHNEKSTTPWHIISKLSNLENKERILKASREKHQLMYKRKHVRTISSLSAQTWIARKACSNIIEYLRVNNCQPRVLYPAKLSFNLNGEIKTF
jgi:hypothetical protein